MAGGEEVEIIVIDDGSTDRTGEIADCYAEKYPETVRAVHQKNGGHGAGVNKGLSLAAGEYFKGSSEKVIDGDPKKKETGGFSGSDHLQLSV